jgi:1-acyl-sn-glycerol-3-phosphate acyltransferase
MRTVNEGAESTRRQVLAAGKALVVFPEGTRDAARVLPLVSDHEVKTACAMISEGQPVSIWPVVLAFGPPRFFRRRVEVRFLPPFVPQPPSPADVLARVARVFEEFWKPPESV